jgi:GNAT superfamily N-acetyltransferase
MDYPRDWDSPHPTPSKVGHQEAGRTIVLHSVAILPHFQGRGLGRVLMQGYIQQMNGAAVADRLALIAHDVSVVLLWLKYTDRLYSIRWHGTRDWVLKIRVPVMQLLEEVDGMIW